jgi:hypothetical protein
MPRAKPRAIKPYVRAHERRRGRKDRTPGRNTLVQPPPESLWQKALALNLDIGLACDVETRRLVGHKTAPAVTGNSVPHGP